MQSIVQHAVRSKSPFTEDQIASLKKESKKISEEKHKIKMAERHQKHKKAISEIKAKKYRTDRTENPEKYEKKNQERKRNYDSDKRKQNYHKHKEKILLKYQTDKIEHPEVYEQKKLERKTRYQAEKFDLALKYQKKKVERTNKKEKIDKVKNSEKKQRALKYKKEMVRIKQKREQMNKNKASDAGYYFDKNILDPIFKKVCDKMEDDHHTIAYGEVMENEESYSDQALENVFQSDLWIEEIDRTMVLDCEEANRWNSNSESQPYDYWTSKYEKPCIHHMDGAEWDKIIGIALEKSHKNEKDSLIQIASDDAFELEWKHAMHKYPDCRGKAPRHSVETAVWHKAFSTTFKQKYINIYEKSYDNAMDKFMLSKNSAHVWKYTNHEKYLDKFGQKNPYYEFDDFLRKELKASEKKCTKK